MMSTWLVPPGPEGTSRHKRSTDKSRKHQRPIYPTIKEQSGTNGKDWTFSFIEGGLVNWTLFSAPSSKCREGESPRLDRGVVGN